MVEQQGAGVDVQVLPAGVMHRMSSDRPDHGGCAAPGAVEASPGAVAAFLHEEEQRAPLHAALQSMITLPESPERATAKAASKSRKPKRWVIAGRMSRPDWSMTVILYQVSYISRP